MTPPRRAAGSSRGTGPAPRGSAGSGPRGSAGSGPRGSAGPGPRGSAGPRRFAGPGHLRLFVALDLPAAVRDALLDFRAAAADSEVWRPVAPEALHVTLAFLGARPEEDVGPVADVLRAAAGPAPRLVVGAALLLPPRRARVLTVALDDPDGTLQALQARVSGGLAAAGVYEPERRAFRAHATVARLRPRARPPRSIAEAPEPLEFHAGSVTLYVSRLHPHGARYEALARVPLPRP